MEIYSFRSPQQEANVTTSIMPSVEDLAQGQEFDLFEASLDEGTTRKKNDKNDPIQRRVITDRGVNSPYKIQAILRACVHGTMTKKTPESPEPQPGSLIVVDYTLINNKEGAYFTSVETTYKFSEYVDKSKGGKPTGVCPSVVAFAPFDVPVIYNESTAEETGQNTAQLEIAPEFNGIKIASIVLGKDTESKHEQRYFDIGTAGTHFDAKSRPNMVWWNVIHNRSQKLGVSPKFRVAMLVAREDNSKFQAKFEIDVHGGFGYAISELVENWIRRTAIDDPIIFDPSHGPMGDLEGIPRDELGKLASDDNLEALSMVWGLSPLKPEKFA